MKSVIFLLVVLGPLLLLAEEVLEDVETPDVTAAEGLPSSLVNGTVCAISGQYIDSMVDVVIQGPESLVISRTCGSLASPNLGCLWSFNHEGFMTGCKAYDREEGPIWLFRICQPSSSYLDYISSRDEEEDKKKDELEPKLREPKGLTNGATTLSGRTNLKNQRMHFYPRKEKIEVVSPVGDKKIYSKAKHKGRTIYVQKAEEKANQSLYTYEFDLHFLMPIQITCQNRRHPDRVYSQVNFSRMKEKEGELHFDLNTSDGRQLSYYFRHHHYKRKIKTIFDDNHNDHYYLTRVEHPYAPSVKYDYEPRSGSDDWNLTSRERPENRFIKTSYYHKGKNHVGGQIGTVEIKDREDRCINRVKKQEAPVGTDATPIVTHRFKYHFKEHHSSDHHKSVEGSTDVYDAYNHLTRYHYDANQRLHSIIRYKGTSSPEPYVKEKFVWGSRKEEKSFLRAKIFQDFNGQVHHARYFDYDERGNVLSSMLCGKLSGSLGAPGVVLNDYHWPENNHYEAEIKTYTYFDNNLIQTETDSNGKTIAYEYDSKTNQIKKKSISYDGRIQLIEEYAYDSNHVLVRKMVKFLSDDAGGFSEFRTTYSPARKEILPLGLPERTEETYKDRVTNEVKLLQMAVFEYSPVGYLLKKEVYDANRALAYTLNWEYDLHGNVIKEVNAMGETILKTYDANDNLILQQHFPSGEEIEYTYDFSNRLIRQKTTYNGQSSTLSYQYNYLSQCVVMTNSYGQETHHTYDSLGRLVTIQHFAVVNENGEVVQPKENKTYDIAGNPICLVDALGRETKIEYNIRGKPTKTIYPDGTVETCLYRMDGQLISKTDRNGVVTNYKRDPLGRITEEAVCSSEGIALKTTHYIYNALHLLRMIDPSGLETTYQYDGAGRLEKTIQGDRVQQHFYDALGRLHEVREWVGAQEHEFRSTIKEYDLLDRVIEERLQAGDGTVLHLQRYVYDHRGNRTLEQIGDQKTITEYNVYNQPMTITNSLGQVTHISYNAEFINAYGQCVLQTTTTDPLGYQTVHTYDTAQRLVEMARYNPFGVRVAYQQKFYDVCGNCCRVLDHVIEAGEEKRTIETQLLYTVHNELEKLTEAFNTLEQKITQFRYNHLGQKEAIIKPDGVTLIHSYDALGRLKSLKSSDDSIDYVYEYNRRDQVLNVTDKVHNQMTFRCYDARGQLDREILGHGLIVEYAYDRVGRVNKIRLPDKSEVEYVYDAVDLKEVHRVIKNKRCYSHVAQTYNLAGQVTQVQLPGKGGMVHYAYDDLGRSVNVKAQAFQQHIPAEGFDEAGNLRLFYAQDVAYHFDYDDLYQLKAEQGHVEHAYQFDSLFNRTLRDKEEHTYNALNQVCQKGKEQLIYDKNGNLKQRKLGKEVTLYDYDALDRLISVKKGKHTVTYVYDPFNRRLSKDQTGRESQLFVYQGQEEVGCWCQGAFQELRLLGEKSRSAMVALEIKGTLYVPVHDLVGNVICLLGAQGEVVERYRYTAFGESEILSPEGKRRETSVVGNPWRYASKRFDEETGFVAFGLRYYDPGLGRWVTADPAGFEDGPNLYAYVHNSPLLYYDRYGLFAVAGLSSSTFEFDQKPYSNDFLPRAGSIDSYANSWSWHTHELPPLFFTEDSARHSLNDMINSETGRNFELKEDLDHRISFSGGIDTNLARHIECLQHISKLSDGYNVRGVHHATRGMWRDIYCYLRSYLGDVPYQAAKLQVQDWIQSIQNSSPNAALLHYTFSRGVADTRLALQLCPKEIRDRIDVRVFGAADFISPDLCRSVVHYICKGDPVSEFAIKTSQKEFEKYRDTIIFIDPLPGQGRLDSHSFTNPVYEPYIKMNSTRYLGS